MEYLNFNIYNVWFDIPLQLKDFVHAYCISTSLIGEYWSWLTHRASMFGSRNFDGWMAKPLCYILGNYLLGIFGLLPFTTITQSLTQTSEPPQAAHCVQEDNKRKLAEVLKTDQQCKTLILYFTTTESKSWPQIRRSRVIYGMVVPVPAINQRPVGMHTGGYEVIVFGMGRGSFLYPITYQQQAWRYWDKVHWLSRETRINMISISRK